MRNTTILIQTFKRPEALNRLLASIPDGANVIVHDDSGIDIGLSAARNKLVRQAPTEFVVFVDDDCVFTKDTNLDLLEDCIKNSDYDIMAIDAGINYMGHYETDGDKVRLIHSEPLEFVPNIFIARRQSLLDHPWDERLKMGEHFAYFYKYRGQLKIAYNPTVKIQHLHITNSEYEPYRSRALGYVKQFMRESGIRERIDDGEHLMA